MNRRGRLEWWQDPPTDAIVFHAVVLAAFRPPDRGLDPSDPKVQERAVEQARREGRP